MPFSVVRPPEAPSPEQAGIIPPPELPSPEIPLYGPLSLPGAEDPGPPGGLTLEAAIGRLLRENLELKALALELPQAEADIETAGLRANPVLFADAQLIPYGSYSEERPGGPTQYDLNITYPLDLSGKRHARVRSATETRRVLEARYRDAVRMQIDRLAGAFVDVIAAREVVRFARASVEGLDEVLEKSQSLYEQGDATKVDVNRIRIQQNTARVALADAEVALLRSKRALADLLNIPPAQADAIQVRGSLASPVQPLPPVDRLVAMALSHRPDVIAFRLGVGLAQADIRLAMANRFEDVFLLYQPFTYQGIDFEGEDPSTSWAIGLTVPLPVYNRNQGNIRRARINSAQTKLELAALQRRVVTEVQDARQEFEASLMAARQIERELLPAAREVIDDTYRLFVGGEADAIAYLNAQRDYNDVVRQYFTALVRHRRSMFALNTAVGRMLLR